MEQGEGLKVQCRRQGRKVGGQIQKKRTKKK